MSYPQARFRLGIATVGTLVLLTAVAFVYQLPSTFFPFYGGPWYADLAALAVFYLVYAVISLPFDFMSGFSLPCSHQRVRLSFPEFLLKWGRGITLHGVVMTTSALAVLEAGKRYGYWGAVATVAVLQVALLVFQTRIAELVGGFSAIRPLPPHLGVKAVAFDSIDPAFSGGFSGLPGLDRLVVPQHWLRLLSKDSLETELLRREGILATGARWRGVVVALTWNTTGFMLSAALPWVSLDSVYGLLEALLGCALWSFLGLFVLPALSRRAVLQADRWAAEQGASKASLLLAMTEIDQLQEDQPPSSIWEGLLHPLPSMQSRIEALDSPLRRSGAWQASRLALFLSWAHFGLLSRAVQSNAGRPELWVVPPGD